MKMKHRDGEDAAGRTVSVTTHLKPEVDEDGFFEIEEDRLTDMGVDPEAARTRLQEAGHTPESEVSEDVSEDQPDEETSQDSEAEAEEEDSGEEGQEEEPATKTELMDLNKDQLVEIGDSFEDVDTDQNKEPLAEDLAEAGVILQEEGGE